MFLQQPITVDTSDIDAKPETIDELINNPVKNMNSIIEQRNRLLSSLSKEDLNNPQIRAKLARLDRTITGFRTALGKMTYICEQATRSIEKVVEKTNTVMS